MKARTKLVYNCNKKEDFDYTDREYKITYDRSFDMWVTTSTKEECEKIMESFEDAISAEGIQDSFDSNQEPEFDEKKNVWVGAVEVYVNNNWVTEEKEAIKEAYNEWKRFLKATPVVVETPEVKSIKATTNVESEKNSWLNDSEIEKIVVKCDTVGGLSCEKCAFKNCNQTNFELVLNKVKKNTPTPKAPATGYISQEERVQSKIDKLVTGKTYSVDDGAGTKMLILKKENDVWWGTVGLWNLFNSLKIDYQEYILNLILE